MESVSHDVLKHVLPNAVFFEEFLRRVLSRSVVVEGDTQNYVDLVRRSVVSVQRSVPFDLELHQKDAHATTVNAVVAELVRAGIKNKERNILTYGLRDVASVDVHGIVGMGSVECTWPNAALNAVRGASWELLHARIGTDFLRFILKHALVFAPLPNNCYLQLCGTSFFHIQRFGNLTTQRLRSSHTSAPRDFYLESMGELETQLPVEFQSVVFEEPEALKTSRSKKLQPVGRSRIFYDEKFIKKPGFSASHVLETAQCRPSTAFARHLCRVVFRQPANKGRVARRLLLAVEPLKRLVRNHQRIKYGFFLRTYCPLPSPKSKRDSDELCIEDILGHEPTYKELIKNHVEHFQVVRFLWACVRRLVPFALWGSKRNMSLVLKMIDHFVRLRRYEDFNVDFFCSRWKMRECEWLPRPKVPAQQISNQNLVGLWLRWLMDDIVISLIRNHFYVTESAMHRNKVFYFRKPLWKQISQVELGNLNVQASLKGMFRRLSTSEAQPLISNEFRLPVSQLRLLPKANGMRLIGNLSARGTSRNDSANFILRPAYEVLRFELVQNGKSHLLGASVFNLGEVHTRILPFIQWLRSVPNTTLYFVSVDVKGSFDSIKQNKLCSVLFGQQNEEIFSSERYILQRYSAHLPCVGNLVSSNKVLVIPAADLQPLQRTLKRKIDQGTNLRNSVVVDKASCDFVERDRIRGLLVHHITKNVIRLGKSFYLQEVGIPQGSVLSSLLCSLFYGHMERHGLSDLPIAFDPNAGNLEKGILLRFIDDNLFISSCQKAAEEFVKRLHGSFVAEYGTQLNPGKTLVNFLSLVEGKTLPRVVSDASFPSPNPCLPWCGVLIDTVTLEFYGDYSRYRGNYLNETLTVTFSRHQGDSLRQKIKQFAQPKCIPLLLDTRINQPSTVQLNVYQVFLLCAIKLHCHVRYLPSKSRNEAFLSDVIVDVIDYTNALIQARLHRAEDLLPAHVRYLGKHAFHAILSKKQTWYPQVLSQLHTQLKSDLYFKGLKKKFATVTDKNKSRMFHFEIIY